MINMNKEDTFQYNGSGPFCMLRGSCAGACGLLADARSFPPAFAARSRGCV